MLCLVRSALIGLVLLGTVAVAQESRADQSAPVPARVTAKKAAVRCYATSRAPLFVDTLEEGDVVKVGPASGGFRPVRLPLGPTGFVSKRYTTEPVEGTVKCKGRDVSFRYRVPKGAEIPVETLADGATLHVLGEEGEWWIVRSPSTAAYVDEKEVTVLEGDATAAEAALKRTADRRQGEWTAAVTSYETARAAARATLERKTKLDELQQRFVAERAKPPASQDYAPLVAELTVLEPEMPKGSDELARCEIMKKELQRQAAVAEVLKHSGEQPVRAVPPEELKPPPVDPFVQKASAIGWLRQRRGSGPGFEIERGGVVQYLVACSSGRYDLTAFVGHELAISGSTDRPSRDSIRVLDAQRIEVLEAKSR